MKEIECPSCGEMIPEDSKYCDMCGVELLACVSCGAIGTDNFCAECGSPMVSRRTLSSDSATSPSSAPETVKDTADVHTTVARQRCATGQDADVHSTGRSAVPRLRFRDGNLVITPRDGAVIGRQDGEYADRLRDFDLISRRHAKFVKQGRNWCLVDLGSTNGCFVNDTELKPDVPVPFKKGDVVDIGTYLFDVL